MEKELTNLTISSKQEIKEDESNKSNSNKINNQDCNPNINKGNVIFNNFNVNLNLNFVGCEKETNLNNISPDEITKKLNKDLKIFENQNTYNYYNINYHLNSFTASNPDIQQTNQSNFSEEIVFIDINASLETSKLVFVKIFLNVFKLTFNKLIYTISDNFQINKQIRVYSFYNREILDTSDLKFLEVSNEYNKIIFFCKIDNNNMQNSHQLQLDPIILKCFKISKVLGEGGFGKVYLAEQRFNKIKYAIKSLKIRHRLDTKYFYKEIEALKKLEHKNIIKMITYCQSSNEKITLILEYGSGGTLLQYINSKGRLSEEESRNIFSQLLAALFYCHQRHIIHRDLKPENILFF